MKNVSQKWNLGFEFSVRTAKYRQLKMYQLKIDSFFNFKCFVNPFGKKQCKIFFFQLLY